MSKKLNEQEMDTSSRKVPLKQKSYYGISFAGVTFIQAIITGAIFKFYTDFMFLSAALVGTAQLAFAIWNAVNDPLIGYFSDRATLHGTKGNRKRWLYTSIPIVLIGFFLMIFMHPSFGWLTLFIVLIIGLAINDTGFAIHTINRNSLLVSITDNDAERSSIVVVSLVFQTILGVFAYLLPLFLLVGDVGLPVIYISLSIAGVIGLTFMLIGVKGIKEPSKLYAGKTMPNLVPLLKEIFKSKSFIFMILFTFFAGLVTTTALTFQVYYFDDVVGLEEGSYAAIAGGIGFPFTLLSYFLIQVCSKKIGPRKTLLIFIVISIIGFFGLIFVRDLWGGIIFYIPVNMGISAIWILGITFIGNIIDEYELKTGDRNEGTFVGINAIFEAIAKGVMSFIFGLILTLFRYNPSISTQTELTKLGITIGLAVVPIVFLFIAFLIILFFPLRGEKLREIKEATKELYDKRL
ncbi:MAG: MFS transporter [Promethearchaeota archaeon]